MATKFNFKSSDFTERASDAEALLNRYPDVDDRELATLIETFKNLPLLDFGILAADQRMGAKLDAFYEDHGDKLRPPLTGVMWAAAVPVFVVLFALIYTLAN